MKVIFEDIAHFVGGYIASLIWVFLFLAFIIGIVKVSRWLQR